MTQLDLTAPASISRGQKRGACPTLREPMLTGDGLLARLRPVGSALRPWQLLGIAQLANRYGNGQLEITARGNLQVRGLAAADVPGFAAAVEDLVAIETGTPVEISPLAGLDGDETADARDLAQAIRTRLAQALFAHRLGPKVTVVINGGGAWDRNALTADVALAAAGAGTWRIEIGGHMLGLVSEPDAAEAVLNVLELIAAMDGRGRDVDVALVRQRLGGVLRVDDLPAKVTPPLAPVTTLRDGRAAAAMWLPFGAVRAGVLLDLARAAEAAGGVEFRLGPHHGLLALCPSFASASQIQEVAGALGLAITPADPRRAVNACIGTEGCASGTIAARQVADALVEAQPELFDGSFALHVSGCPKGCAHPGAALLTLAGTDMDVNLIVDGTTKGAPALSLLPHAVPHAVARLAALWRDERALGESVASCFKRLGATAIAAAARQGWQ